MPELPEIETVKNGMSPHIINSKITQIICSHQPLRYPLAESFVQSVMNQKITDIKRRGKHLIIKLDHHYLIIHLGMSGTLQVKSHSQFSPQKHDHIILYLSNHNVLFYNDPRRFGYWILCQKNPLKHPCFKNYGPEPLTDAFNGQYLLQQLATKKQAIKTVIMDNRIVIGVGNIYANESLFLAKIHPQKQAQLLSLNECNQLTHAIKETLKQAIIAGGTTLKDYKNAQGKPGYFTQDLKVYGKKSLACSQCNTPICSIRVNQRNTFFCPNCQK